MSEPQRLIEAVERGDATEFQFLTWRPGLTGTVAESKRMIRAYNGDLNAAKALHEALLPGWQYHLSDGSASVEGTAWETYAQSETTARAWLLAILRAVEAKGGVA